MQKVYSVGQVNSYIKSMFDQDFVLSRIGIRGEVSNCKYHTSGHIYFSLKDAEGTIACVMFASARKGLAFRLCDGQQAVVRGSITVYERDGRYQMYAREIQLDGAGLLYERYLALKQELEEMGMFAPEYKQPIPVYAKRLGVVTAPTGAAIRDIINISSRRNPWIQIILYPALVQGQGAAQSVAAGIRALDELGVDVMIVGRGGGSIEDLWAFNEEAVARAIFECRTPVISAVGHETDVTIADFVADLRAPTPSAAAELAVADVRGLLTQLEETRRRLQQGMERQLQEYRREIQHYQMMIYHGSPEQKLLTWRQRMLDLEDKLQAGVDGCVREKQHQLSLYIEKLRGLSPLDKLAQGFACVTDVQGKRIYSVDQTRKGDEITIYVSDGRICGQVLGNDRECFGRELDDKQGKVR